MSGAVLSTDSSLSSSGYEDGLGRRLLAIERETGEMLERLLLRPELCAFEQVLNTRISALAALEDERFARPRALERDEDGRLVAVSEYVPGRRLLEILDAAVESGVAPGIDAALGLLLELLPALGNLHGLAKFAHGALAAGRVLFTPAGQLVILDAIYAAPLERLQFTRQRLWNEFDIAAPPSAGPVRLDPAADLTQAGMIAAAFVVGRPLKRTDYPTGLDALRGEILEVAQIRGSTMFANGVQRFFDRVLPIAGRKPYTSADDAVSDLRQLVRRELGIDACRTALIDFLQQVDAADIERTASEAAILEALQEERRVQRERAEAARRETERFEGARREAERLEAERKEKERREKERAERKEAERREKERLEAERREREQVEAAQREAERLEAEQRERERLEAQRLEQERLERERLEQERIARELAEAARREAERIEAERLEKERVEQERRERERRERERLEKERIAREQAEAARREAERLEAEQRERERLEAERLERERLELERRQRELLEQQRIERERVEAAKREAERLAAEQRERERLEAERREQERLERERLEQERLERERAEAARREAERLEAERREQERREAERLERERLEKERLERLRIERERVEAARREAQRLEQEHRERLRVEAERQKKEEQARREAERQKKQEAERLEAERQKKVEAERLEAKRQKQREEERIEAERQRKLEEEQERLEAARKTKIEQERVERERQEAAGREAAEREAAERKAAERAAAERAAAERAAAERAAAERAARAEAERLEKARPEAERGKARAPEQAHASGGGKRRKREKSARARKDRLRSSESPAAPAPAAAPATSSSWLVPPDRAAAFEPPVPVQPASAQPPALPPPPFPTPAAQYPVYVPPGSQGTSAPSPSWTVTPAASLAPPAPVAPAAPRPLPPPITEIPGFRTTPGLQPAGAPIRLKNDSSSSRHGSSGPRVEPRRPSEPPHRDLFEPSNTSGVGNPFPWKFVGIAAAALVLLGGGILYFIDRKPAPAPARVNVSAPVHAAEPVAPPTTGQIAVATQPPGLRVLLDGKPTGESPVTLEGVSPGRHVVTLISATGAVKRTVRVEAGKSVSIDVPIFSGFVAVSSPILVDVSENGRSLGTSENQIMLTPGHHELRFSNKDLQYTDKHGVDIEPGEVQRVELDPHGTININAQPWAEVWIDGQKAGETPLANLPIPLGVREIVFKHPQFGERKMTTTVTGGTPAAVSVDFTKQ